MKQYRITERVNKTIITEYEVEAKSPADAIETFSQNGERIDESTTQHHGSVTVQELRVIDGYSTRETEECPF